MDFSLTTVLVGFAFGIGFTVAEVLINGLVSLIRR